jgi:cysteine-rich repeat protein
MRKRIVLSAVSMGLLVACGPVAVDLGGGAGGQAGSGGTGRSTGGVGGAYVTGGTGGYPDQFCGDGVIQEPEECDDPRGLDPACTPDCLIRYDGGGGTGGYAAGGRGGTGGSPDQFCGDGVIQEPEECDDPRGLDPACTPDCLIRGGSTGGTGGGYGAGGTGGVPAGGTGGTSSESICGNGVIDRGENCDDGNREDGDGCSSDCLYVDGGTGGSPAGGRGGTGGTGATGNECSTEIVQGSDGECVDNDVLFGRAYERCEAYERALVGVRFTNPCGDYSSYSMEVDCCVRATEAGGAGGTGGRAYAGAGGSD